MNVHNVLRCAAEIAINFYLCGEVKPTENDNLTNSSQQQLGNERGRAVRS